MATSSMLIDSSESLGSSEEEHVHLDMHHQMSWEEAVVSEEDEEEEVEGDGILILRSNNTSRAEETNQELELSTIESVATDLPSIDTTRPVENVTMLLGERSQAGEEPDLLSDSTAGGGGINVQATVLIRGTDGQRSIQGQEHGSRRSVGSQWILFGSLLVFFSLVGSTLFLAHDRRQLQAQAREAELHRTKAAELEEQVRRLEEEKRAEEQAKQQRRKREQRKQYQEFPWESGKNDATIMDNCWAQVQMGECSREATKTVKKQVVALGQSALKTSQTIYNQIQHDAATVGEWLQDLSQKSSRDDPLFFQQNSSSSGNTKTKKSEAAKVKEQVVALGQCALKTSQTIYKQIQRDTAAAGEWLQDLSQKSRDVPSFFQPSSSSSSSWSNTKNKESEATSKKQDEDKKSTVENFKTVGKTMLTTVALGAVTVGVFAGIEALFPNANLKDENSDNDYMYYTANP